VLRVVGAASAYQLSPINYQLLEMERVNGVAPSSQPWQSRVLLLNHTRENGVPSRTLTDNLTLRTRPLCVLSYGDKMVGVPSNAPGLGTHLVRFRL
jgi:hypothetical protein